MPESVPLRWLLPPDQKEKVLQAGFSAKTRILHMRPPWGVALVSGFKTVENRSSPLVPHESMN